MLGCSSEDETLYGESTKESGPDAELSGESGSIMPGHDNLSGESMPGRPRDRDRVLPGESKSMKNKSQSDWVDSISSSDDSKSQTWKKVSETTSNSDASMIVIC